MFRQNRSHTPPRGIAAVLFGIQLTLIGLILALIGAGAVSLIPAGLGVIVGYNGLYRRPNRDE